MTRLKKKGFNFPELEKRGWLEGWLEDEDDEDPFLNNDKNNSGPLSFSDWTIKDLESFDKFKVAPTPEN